MNGGEGESLPLRGLPTNHEDYKIRRMDIRPDDIIVLTIDRQLNQTEADGAKDSLTGLLQKMGHKNPVVVLGKGVSRSPERTGAY